MSTKNLARTVIEGGRFESDKYDRRQSLRYWRRDNRRFCDAVRMGVRDCEAESAPDRDVGYRWRDEIHRDKTRPCYRFLASRAGRRWDDVRSEIHARFNVRTLAGRHVVYAHLVDLVQRAEEPRFWYLWEIYGGPKFWIDANGILRHNPQRRY